MLPPNAVSIVARSMAFAIRAAVREEHPLAFAYASKLISDENLWPRHLPEVALSIECTRALFSFLGEHAARPLDKYHLFEHFRCFAIFGPNEQAHKDIIIRLSNFLHPLSPRMINMDQQIFTKIQEEIATLGAALLAKDPRIPVHLRTIHGLLRSYPESAVLLSDEEIRNIVEASEHHTKVFIVEKTEAVKGRKKLAVSDF